MSNRNTDPWGDFRRDREDVSMAAAFFMTFALLGLIAWVIFFGTAWIVPAAVDALPISPTRTPASYASAGSIAEPGVSFPITSTGTTAAAATTAPPAAPKPTATPTAKPATTKLELANTGGDGVYLRRNPNDTDLWIPWPETTVVDYMNEDQETNSRLYKKVRDPRGNVGWMPAEYLVPAG